MNYMRYKRSYIMLESVNVASTLKTNKKAPIKGFLKFETGSNKGLLRCSLQNLTISSTKDPFNGEPFAYKLFLVGKTGEKLIGIDLGKLNLDDKGNGGLAFRFNPLNINGLGFPLNSFSKALIASAKDFTILLEGNLSPNYFPLSNEDLKFIMTSNTKEDLEHVAPENAIPENSDSNYNNSEDKIYENSNHEINSHENINLKDNSYENNSHEDNNYKDNNHKNIAYENNNYNDNIFKDKSKITETTSQNTENKAAELNLKQDFLTTANYYKDHLKNTCDHMANITGLYEKISPFNQNEKADEYNWWKVMNVMNLPFASINAYPSCHDLVYKYHHYIFGILYNENKTVIRYCFGIPGKYSKDEQPDEGKSGFIHWQPIEGASVAEGSYGYWLLSIDPSTGDFVAY